MKLVKFSFFVILFIATLPVSLIIFLYLENKSYKSGDYAVWFIF